MHSFFLTMCNHDIELHFAFFNVPMMYIFVTTITNLHKFVSNSPKVQKNMKQLWLHSILLPTQINWRLFEGIYLLWIGNQLWNGHYFRKKEYFRKNWKHKAIETNKDIRTQAHVVRACVHKHKLLATKYSKFT